MTIIIKHIEYYGLLTYDSMMGVINGERDKNYLTAARRTHCISWLNHMKSVERKELRVLKTREAMLPEESQFLIRSRG